MKSTRKARPTRNCGSGNRFGDRHRSAADYTDFTDSKPKGCHYLSFNPCNPRNPWLSHNMKTLYVLVTVLAFEIASAQGQTLNGAIDMHAHSYPDGVARSIDAIDLAKLAKSRGMRAIVLKNHYEPTTSLACIGRKGAPGIEVFGGI